MSSWTENPAFSGNPDKEAMQMARRAMRDQAIRELAEAEELGNATTSDISKLRVKVSQLRHACAKYLVYHSWMKNRIGGSHMYDTYPETRAEADAAIELYRSRKVEFDLHYPSGQEEDERNRFVAIDNQAEWWDGVCQ